jgi:hypothetical protein
VERREEEVRFFLLRCILWSVVVYPEGVQGQQEFEERSMKRRGEGEGRVKGKKKSWYSTGKESHKKKSANTFVYGVWLGSINSHRLFFI